MYLHTQRACHEIYLDPMNGLGLVVLPDPEQDIPAIAVKPAMVVMTMDEIERLKTARGPGGSTMTAPGAAHSSLSLQDADWAATTCHLVGLGWELLQGDERDTTRHLDGGGCPTSLFGWTKDGREVIALHGPSNDPRHCGLSEMHEYHQAIADYAGVTRRLK